MVRPQEVQAQDDYRLWLHFDDGSEGVVDLSHLVGRGVFVLWEDPASFQKVRIEESGAVAWSDQVELCPDALYLKVTGREPESLFQEPLRASA